MDKLYYFFIIENVPFITYSSSKIDINQYMSHDSICMECNRVNAIIIAHMLYDSLIKQGMLISNNIYSTIIIPYIIPLECLINSDGELEIRSVKEKLISLKYVLKDEVIWVKEDS